MSKHLARWGKCHYPTVTVRITGWSKLNGSPMQDLIPELLRVPTLAQPSLHIVFLSVHCSSGIEHPSQSKSVKSPSSDPSPLMRGTGKNLGQTHFCQGKEFKVALLNFAQLLIVERFYSEFKYLPVV